MAVECRSLRRRLSWLGLAGGEVPYDALTKVGDFSGHTLVYELTQHSPCRLPHEPASLADLYGWLRASCVGARYESSEAVPNHLTVAWHSLRAARLLRQGVACTLGRSSVHILYRPRLLVPLHCGDAGEMVLRQEFVRGGGGDPDPPIRGMPYKLLPNKMP